MFGTLRLILAAVVAYSHSGVSIGWESGVAAVTVFFMISGYAMTGLIQSRFSDYRSAPTFALERLVRLAPQYYFWLSIALIAMLCLPWYQVNTNGFIPYGLFAYLTVIPLGLQRYVGSVDTHIMSQATTLGIEITFYILSPWILQSRSLSWAAGLVSLTIFAATALKILPDNIYTYYTSPGPIVLYVIGSFIYRKDWLSTGSITSLLLIILILSLPKHFEFEILLGTAIGLPVITLLSRLPPSKLDAALGDASYGCFLGHFIVFIAIKQYFGITEFTAPMRVLAIVLACFAGYLSYWLVERPTVPFRRKLKGSTGSSQNSSVEANMTIPV